MEVDVSEGMTEPSQSLELGEKKRVDKECRGSLWSLESQRGVFATVSGTLTSTPV